MLTDFSDAIYTELLSRNPSGHPVPRQALHTPDIPPVVAHFLEHALDRRLELESRRSGEIAPDWVDHDSEAVKLARAAYLRVLGQNAHFPAGDWPRALRQAVQLVSAYLVRPVPTLTHFVFGEQEVSLPGDDVLRRAGYFLPFGHIKAAAEAFIERRPGAVIERRALSEALEKVDQALSQDYQSEDWKKALMPLLDLAEIVPDSRGLPISVVEAFFEYRKQRTTAARMRQASRTAGHAELSREELFRALDPVPEPPPVTASPAASPAPAGATAKDATPAHADFGPPQPLWQQFQGASSRAPSGAETTVAASPSATPPAADDMPLWKRFQSARPVDVASGATNPAAGSPTPPATRGEAPLTRAISAATPTATPTSTPTATPTAIPRTPDEIGAPEPAAWQAIAERRSYFVGALFHGDDRQFDEVINRIRRAEDWSTASQIIGTDVYRRNKVDIYSEPALAFTRAVEEHFSTR